MRLCASTGPVLWRCWQHRPSTGPVLAHNRMFMGTWSFQIYDGSPDARDTSVVELHATFNADHTPSILQSCLCNSDFVQIHIHVIQSAHIDRDYILLHKCLKNGNEVTDVLQNVVLMNVSITFFSISNPFISNRVSNQVWAKQLRAQKPLT